MPSMRKPAAGGLVYSTEGGRMCPQCRQPLTACECAAQAAKAALAKSDGVVRVSRETKGRGGKAVTLVRGVPLPPDDLAALAKRLRTACGSGMVGLAAISSSACCARSKPERRPARRSHASRRNAPTEIRMAASKPSKPSSTGQTRKAAM